CNVSLFLLFSDSPIFSFLLCGLPFFVPCTDILEESAPSRQNDTLPFVFSFPFPVCAAARFAAYLMPAPAVLPLSLFLPAASALPALSLQAFRLPAPFLSAMRASSVSAPSARRTFSVLPHGGPGYRPGSHEPAPARPPECGRLSPPPLLCWPRPFLPLPSRWLRLSPLPPSECCPACSEYQKAAGRADLHFLCTAHT